MMRTSTLLAVGALCVQSLASTVRPPRPPTGKTAPNRTKSTGPHFMPHFTGTNGTHGFPLPFNITSSGSNEGVADLVEGFPDFFKAVMVCSKAANVEECTAKSECVWRGYCFPQRPTEHDGSHRTSGSERSDSEESVSEESVSEGSLSQNMDWLLDMGDVIPDSPFYAELFSKMQNCPTHSDISSCNAEGVCKWHKGRCYLHRLSHHNDDDDEKEYTLAIVLAVVFSVVVVIGVVLVVCVCCKCCQRKQREEQHCEFEPDVLSKDKL